MERASHGPDLTWYRRGEIVLRFKNPKREKQNEQMSILITFITPRRRNVGFALYRLQVGVYVYTCQVKVSRAFEMDYTFVHLFKLSVNQRMKLTWLPVIKERNGHTRTGVGRPNPNQITSKIIMCVSKLKVSFKGHIDAPTCPASLIFSLFFFISLIPRIFLPHSFSF